jgi:YebC/PmpR family DNA-binding regulatory protein
MAGHSKWANIKHRKAGQDAKRGKIFTKLIREIVVSAKLGGEDPDANPRLRAAIDNALSQNMTRDTVNRAVKRGAGTDEADNMVEMRYEGYGPGGVAVIVDCLSDNKNRTVGEVRHAFTKTGGNLGTDGSVAYMFKKIGLMIFSDETDEDQLMEQAIEAGADDVQAQDDGSFEVITDPNEFLNVKEALIKAGLEPEHAEVTMLADTEATLDFDTAEKMLRFQDMLEDLDDVQNVYSNADIPANILEELNR